MNVFRIVPCQRGLVIVSAPPFNALVVSTPASLTLTSDTNDTTSLKSGGSRFPIESLKVAGVDMSSPAPIAAACAVFKGLVDELEGLM
jgi:hypothetical protein